MGNTRRNLKLAGTDDSLKKAEPESVDFEAAFDDRLSDTLDLNTWTLGEDLAAAFGRIEQEVADALKKENEYSRIVRQVVFPQISSAPDAAPTSGVYQASRKDLERIHAGLLFNGGVEACDGTNVVHDTLPLTITQIGVCLVSYS